MMINSTLQALEQLGYGKSPVPHEKLKQLDDEGFCLLEPSDHYYDWLGADLNALRSRVDELVEKEGEKAGFEGREEYFKKGKRYEPCFFWTAWCRKRNYCSEDLG